MKSCQDEQACYEVKDMIIHNRSCVVTKPAMKRNAQPCMGVAALVKERVNTCLIAKLANSAASETMRAVLMILALIPLL